MKKGRLLVVDDEESLVQVIRAMLINDGYEIHCAYSGEGAIEILDSIDIDLVISDLKMDGLDGMGVLEHAKEINHGIGFIMITAFGTLRNAVEAMRRGAADYIIKPFGMDELRMRVRQLMDRRRLELENVELKMELRKQSRFEGLVGSSEKMRDVYDIIKKVAPTDSTVLIYGASGTGKELVARAIHFHSKKCDGPFVAFGCGALPESLLESELFGHVKGSFTGAIKDKEGLFMAAAGGTIFLDEISATSPGIQMKLLRVLQEKEIRRVGDTRNIKVDVRVVAATNEILRDKIGRGEFRQDLYYRLSVIPIDLPELAERKEDIPLLVKHFLEKYKGEAESPKKMGPEVLEILMHYDWPGNVRELENVVERCVTLSDNPVIRGGDLPKRILEPSRRSNRKLRAAVHAFEREYIKKIMRETNGNKPQVARILDIDLATLYRKIDRLGLSGDEGLGLAGT